jgi:cation transport ATPase
MTDAPTRGRSKTAATWLALLGGALGLHRFYLYGIGDRWGWLLWLPTLLGAYGVERMRALGQDDRLAWVLMPLLGLTLAGTMLNAIVYGLMPAAKWQARHDRSGTAPSWPALDVLGAVVALALGATALMASTAFIAQRYFEHAAETRATEAQSNSQRLPR